MTEDKCAALVNEEALRVVYKNNYGFGVKIFNIYMVRAASALIICHEFRLIALDLWWHKLG